MKFEMILSKLSYAGLLFSFLLIGRPALAQEPPEVPFYFAVGIPDEKLPTIDGDINDWEWVDESFKITIDEMNPLVGGADDADDLFIELTIGWSQTSNRIYGAIHVHDDELIVDKNPTCTFRDDNCEVHFDPDNQGGGPYSAPNDQDLQPAYQMCLNFSEQFSRVQMYNGALGNFEQDALDFWWTHSGDFVDVGRVNTGQEYYYEFSAAMFDPLSISGGPDASTRWILAPEQTIGMSISVDDADSGLNANGNDPMAEECCENGFFWQAQYSMAEQFMNTGGMPDVFLMPVESDLVVAYPNGGEVWEKGTTRNIRWVAESSIADVKIEYSRDGGLNWDTIIASAENNGRYEWEVVGPPTETALVRVSDAVDGDPVDTSNEPFSVVVVPPKVSQIFPHPDAGIYPDARFTMRFDKPMDPGTLNESTFLVSGSVSGPVTGTIAYDATSLSATFAPGNAFQVGETVSVRLTGAIESEDGLGLDSNGDGFADGSPDDDYTWSFQVVEPLKMTAYPAVEPPVIDGRIVNGEYGNAAPVYVEFSNPSMLPGIVPKGMPLPEWPGDLSFTAYALYTSEDLYIAVDAADDVLHDDSPEAWNNDAVAVKIDGDRVSNDVAIDLEYDNPEGFLLLMDISGKWASDSQEMDKDWFAASRTHAGGRTIEFRIPLVSIDTEDGEGTAAPVPGDVIGLNIDIIDDDDGGGSDLSGSWTGAYENPLRNRESDWGRLYLSPEPSPPLTIITPNGSEVWSAGSVQVIRWTGGQNVTYVQLDYSTDYGEIWNAITSEQNSGSYTWKLPETVTDAALVRVSATGGVAQEDVSDRPFVISEPVRPVIGYAWVQRRAVFPGESFDVFAQVSPGEGDIAQVQAELYSEDTQQRVQGPVALLDDGVEPDQVLGDGVYSARLNGEELGEYSLDILAENSSGQKERRIDANRVRVVHTIVQFPERVLVSTEGLADSPEEVLDVRVPLLIEDDGSGYLTKGFLSSELEFHLWESGLDLHEAEVDFVGSGLDGNNFTSDSSESRWGDGDSNRSIIFALAAPEPLFPGTQTETARSILAFVDMKMGLGNLDHLGMNIWRVDFDEDDERSIAWLGGRLEVGRGDVDLNQAIDALDASLLLMHTVYKLDLYWPDNPNNAPVEDEYGFEVRDGIWRLADISGYRGITAFDAALLLQRIVGEITHFPSERGACRLWEGPSPAWWDPGLDTETPAARPALAARSPLERRVSLGPVEGGEKGTVVVPVVIDEMEGVLAGTFGLSFDSRQFRVDEVRRAALTADFLLAHHAEDGRLRVSFAGADWKPGPGTLADVVLRRLENGSEEATEVRLSEVLLNEGNVVAQVDPASVRLAGSMPEGFALHANYPNPFNPQTTILYDLGRSGRMRLNVFNLSGQRVRKLVDGQQTAGSHRVLWDGLDDRRSPLGSGVYLYRLETEEGIQVRKMLLLK